MSVAVAVEDVGADRQGAEFVDGAGQTELQHLVAALIAARDVGRRLANRLDQPVDRLQGRRGPWLGRVVGAVKDEMGGVEVKTIERRFGEPKDGLGDVGEDVVPLVGEGVESAGEPVVVELLGRHVPEIFGAVLASPLLQVDEGEGLMEPSGQEDGENLAVRNLGLGGEMPIEDGRDVEGFEEGPEDGQGPDGNGVHGVFDQADVDECHSSSMKRRALRKRAVGNREGDVDGVDRGGAEFYAFGQEADEKIACARPTP
jgi:hypothetical protein